MQATCRFRGARRQMSSVPSCGTHNPTPTLAHAGHLPFEGREKAEIKRAISLHRMRPLPPSISPACADFLRCMLTHDPSARPSAADLLLHPFLALHVPLERLPVSSTSTRPLSGMLAFSSAVPVRGALCWETLLHLFAGFRPGGACVHGAPAPPRRRFPSARGALRHAHSVHTNICSMHVIMPEAAAAVGQPWLPVWHRVPPQSTILLTYCFSDVICM